MTTGGFTPANYPEGPYVDFSKPQVSLEDVFGAIEREREYQDAKWGTVIQNPHDEGDWVEIMQQELNEAKSAWRGYQPTSHLARRKSVEYGTETLKEILQVVAVGVACLQQHGIVEREL